MTKLTIVNKHDKNFRSEVISSSKGTLDIMIQKGMFDF